MLDDDHRRRVARLLRGERHVSDLERLFADLRLAQPGRASVREIGHFAAHRKERSSGISLERVNDLQTSARLWHKQLCGETLTIDDLKEAGRANLNIMPDERIKERLGVSRQTASQSFGKALRKHGAGKPLKQREAEALKLFGCSMTWQYRFDDGTLVVDFTDLLREEGSLPTADAQSFRGVGDFVTLYSTLR